MLRNIRGAPIISSKLYNQSVFEQINVF